MKNLEEKIDNINDHIYKLKNITIQIYYLKHPKRIETIFQVAKSIKKECGIDIWKIYLILFILVRILSIFLSILVILL